MSDHKPGERRRLWFLRNSGIIVLLGVPIFRMEEVTLMVSQRVVIKNPTGLHLRPAGILCKEAMKYKSLITFSFRESTANAKSVLSVLGACVKCGDEIEFVCDGDDESEALQALINAVDSGLGE